LIKCNGVSEKAIQESIPCAVSVEGEPEPESEPGIKAGTSARDEALLDTWKQLSEVDGENPLKQREKRKNTSRAIANKIRSFDPHRADEMDKCGSIIHRDVCKGCGSEKYRAVSTCKDRLCPTCASRRSVKLAERYKAIIDRVTDGKYGYHLVLTFKSVETLPDQKKIVALVKKLRLHPLWKSYGGIDGGLWSIEVTRSKGLWHPHVHMLIFTNEPLPVAPDGFWPRMINQRVSDVWRELTGDSFIVRGSRFDGRVIEMVKYMGKPMEIEKMSVDHLDHLSEWCKSRRMVQTFGSLYGQGVDEKMDVDPCACVECGGMSFERTVLRHIPRYGRYVADEVYDVDYCFPDESAHSPP
jgi:hypothetical protein